MVAVTSLAFWEAGVLTTPIGSIAVSEDVAHPPPLSRLLLNIGVVLIAVSLTVAATSMVLRLRRSRGETRQQLRWFAYAATALPIGLIYLLIVQLGNGGQQTLAAVVPLYVAYVLLPVSIGVAAHPDLDFVVFRDAMVWPMVAAGTSNDRIQVARETSPAWDRDL